MTKFRIGEIVEVPFPFVDRPIKKRRPAMVLADPITGNGHEILILVMITSAGRPQWEQDVEILEWEKAGLHGPSILRWKIFSLDSTLVLGSRGSLSGIDMDRIAATFQRTFGPLCRDSR